MNQTPRATFAPSASTEEGQVGPVVPVVSVVLVGQREPLTRVDWGKADWAVVWDERAVRLTQPTPKPPRRQLSPAEEEELIEYWCKIALDSLE